MNPRQRLPYYLTSHVRSVSLRRWKHEPSAPAARGWRRGRRLYQSYHVWFFQDRSGKRSSWSRRKSLAGFLYRITRVSKYEPPKPPPPPPPPSEWVDGVENVNARLRAYRLPFKSWDDQSDKLLPREWPLKWLHVPTGFLIKDRGEMTRKRLGLTGRAGAFLTTDLEWWSIVRIPEDWAEVVTAGQVGTPLAISSTTTKGAEPMKRRKRTVFALIGLPHTWEPPPGEWKASQRAKKAGRVFHPTPPGYTIAGFAEHMHARIWSKRERRKMVRWKAHVKQYEASYNHRFKVSITFEPVELIGYAVRMWL